MIRTRHPRRGLIALALAIAAVATTALIGAATASSRSVAVYHAHGAGVRAASSAGDVPFTFAFDATTSPDRDSVLGTFSGSWPHDDPFPAPGDFADFAGVVTCLQVSGKTATVGGVITSGHGYDGNYDHGQLDLAGDWFVMIVQDNGPPKSNSDLMSYVDWGDRTYFAGIGFDSFNSLCNNAVEDVGAPQFPLLSGDISVGGPSSS